MQEQIPGIVTGDLVGFVMKEMVRRASKAIRDRRTDFEAQQKLGYTGKMDDVVTSADTAAQDVYVRMIRGGFPQAGIIAEEAGLRIESTEPSGRDLYFTIDPLDGTKAFVRSQSHGVATMVALVLDGIVIASCVGNVMTKELYYYRPGGHRVHRIGEAERSERLSPKIGQMLSSQYALIRDRPEAHTSLVHRMLAEPSRGGLCRSFQTADGSVGLSMARLWNGEVGLTVLPAINTTPWDTTPVFGINQRLGILQLQQNEEGRFVPAPYEVKKEVFYLPETIYLHESNLEEFLLWQEKTLEIHR